VLKVWPPLNVFRTSNNLIEVFVIRDPIFTVNSVEYRDGQIVMQVDFSEEYLDKEIIVEFIPEEAIDDRYYASVNSSAVKFVPLNFYSPFVFNSSSLIRVICYMVSFMGMIGILIGLVSKRLAGIEAMFVYQIAWVSMLWVNSYMHLPYKETFPLQFANGFRHTFVPNSEPQNATSRLLQAGNSGSLTVGPHAE
jgi:hypothetical protein